MSSSFHLTATPSDFRGLPKQSADMRNPQYQALKGRIHEELLGRLNLERLARVRREDAEPEPQHGVGGEGPERPPLDHQ